MADSYPTTRRTCGSCRHRINSECYVNPPVVVTSIRQTEYGATYPVAETVRPYVGENEPCCRFYAPAEPEVAS